MNMYDGEKAAAYAMEFWCRRNPAYPVLKYDGGNFVSQCLVAGGLSMEDTTDAESGWWFRQDSDTYSFSWAEPNGLRWYLYSPPLLSQMQEVAIAAELTLGDLIFYDFSGMSAYGHVAIVTEVGLDGEPKVCAHSKNFYQHTWFYPEKGDKSRYVFYHFL